MLNPDKKKEAEEFLKNYKYAVVCRRCRKIYGSDFPSDNGICSKCKGVKNG